MPSDPLVLGPLMRYVDETSATIWVETDDASVVTVHIGGRIWSAPTFGVHGHHYAIVVVRDLAPGSITPYTVCVDDRPVWPPRPAGGVAYPPSVIATLEPERPLRLTFGSCRTSVDHGGSGNRKHGVDALRALALRMAGPDAEPWPDLVLFLGDQVYADETDAAMHEFIRSRRDITQPPGTELADYDEYAHLYRLAWTDPANRWLLSTLPSAMVFDDHDVRDDWNTSLAWKQRMQSTSWWQRRVVAGLSSYWVYQHLGNLSPTERAEDPLWKRVLGHHGPGEVDLTAELDALSDRVDGDPEAYRWSYSRDLAGVRLIVLDSRAARVLEPGRRRMLDAAEMSWLDGRMAGGFRHLLVGSSLPFLLPPGLHHIEAWNEAVADGAWGESWRGTAERIRQGVDLEHWAAFQISFREVARMVTEVADGRRGAPPRTVTFLSGDVHHSYLSEVQGRERGARILQAVCSPIRNPLPRAIRAATAVLARPAAGFVGSAIARSARVPRSPWRWRYRDGPWFDNNIATLEDRPDGLAIRWETGVVATDRLGRPGGGDPQLETVRELLVDERDAVP